MNNIQSIAVFCGAGVGAQAIYRQTAADLGTFLAQQGIKVVFGGGKIGMMGAVADAALAAQGEVIGVIPHFLHTHEVAHTGVTQLMSVDTMHDRKMLMHQLSDAVIVLPGGYGTLDELFEMLTWGQLGLHRKPIGILNIAGYFDHLLQFVEHTSQQQFLLPAYQQMLLHHTQLPDLLAALRHYQAPTFERLIDTTTT